MHYVYLAADTRKRFFEDLAFYGALYLLANKSTYSVSQKEVCVQILSVANRNGDIAIFFLLLIY